MDKEKVLNLALVFESEIEDKLKYYARQLAEDLPTLCVPGINSIPHMSVAQIYGDITAEEIWLQAQDLVKSPVTLELEGLYFDRKIAAGKMNFGVRVSLTEELFDLQQKIVEIFGADNVITAKGLRYFPHITLGFGNLVDNLPAMSFGEESMTGIQVRSFLALGQTGPNWQYTRNIYSSLS